jgi:6-phospho-3-hexuloisomerase
MTSATDETLANLATRAAHELAGAVSGVSDEMLDEVCSAVTAAERIALYGVGREGLMMRALAMRLYHLGLAAHVVGEMTTPPVATNDLLAVSAGPGHFATVEALMDVARADGAGVMLFTAQPNAALAGRADHVVCLPARTMAVEDGEADAVLPMGSAYEGAQYLFFELVVRALRQRLRIDEQAMRERHTNLE